MNLPNALTLLRIFFVPLLVAVLVQDGRSISAGQFSFSNEQVALGIFLAAAFTDLLDGWLARRWNQITTVGMLLDPIADKLLISAALISLVQVGRVAGWMAVLMIGREFAVSGLRSIAAGEGYVIEATELGKTKMVLQVLAIALILGTGDFSELAWLAQLSLWAAMVFALASAADYFRKFWGVLDAQIKARRRGELLKLERERQREALQNAKAMRNAKARRTQS
jgi:CDP-diacylglycerol--glycerol-3-phosphate 3-phosphatidyltransferase